MKQTKFVCPNCGAEFEIAEHQYVTTGMVIGKDSGLGIVSPKVVGQCDIKHETPKMSNAEKTIAALKNAGVDTSNYFALTGAGENEMVARLDNGKISVVPDDDPVFALIKSTGTIPNRNLFRRWVMSQVFHMLSVSNIFKGDFNKALYMRGYNYQFEVMKNELRAQMLMSRNGDTDNYEVRTLFFDKETVLALVDWDIEQLKKHIEGLPEKNFQGQPYKRIFGRNVLCKDIIKDVFEDMYCIRLSLERSFMSGTPKDIYDDFVTYCDLRCALRFETRFCREFVDAYKGSGAYATVKNLVLFHGCHVFDEAGVRYDTDGSMRILEQKARDYAHGEGWRLFGFMKKVIADNHIDIDAKMREWRK